ncbi:hypothetical protein ACFQPA_17190 [Halomarina halobia]|uniref:DUF997 family protein n=1 Tax=Halomarina halobia TaxID=3033386 RepID=A0ABD6ADJ3_9EURY|nr:hypothetical protein [Halomarina sp. PSR21]
MSTETESSSRQGSPEIGYSDVEIQRSAGLRPMMVTAALVLISWILLTGLPIYWQSGDGELTLFTYTSVLWGVVIIVLGFVYEYWVTSLENDEEGR